MRHLLLTFVLLAPLCLLSISTSGPAQAQPGKNLYRVDQLPGTAKQIEAGKQAFVVCGGCHGAAGAGVQGLAPRLNSPNWLATVSNDYLATTIREGRTGSNMVPWDGGLGEETVDNIVSYIRSWQTTEGVKLDESELQGDAETGSKLFLDICAACHGVRGAGYAAGVDGIGIGRRSYLSVATNGMIREMMRSGKDKTPMESFTKGSAVVIDDLSDAEVDSIIAHLRAQAW